MSRLRLHPERHVVERTSWLRAAVLGANDGIVSTASLIVGVAAAATAQSDLLIAGVAGLVAGAMSMAAGEYVSVSSQADSEKADLRREQAELQAQPDQELEELTQIYAARGVDRDLAHQVAAQLMAHDPLGAHARDELGISAITAARPIPADITPAATFSVGAALPLSIAILLPQDQIVAGIFAASLASLALLGAIAAKAGGAKIGRAVLRVTFWGAFAMGLTAFIGTLFGTVA